MKQIKSAVIGLMIATSLLLVGAGCTSAKPHPPDAAMNSTESPPDMPIASFDRAMFERSSFSLDAVPDESYVQDNNDANAVQAVLPVLRVSPPGVREDAPLCRIGMPSLLEVAVCSEGRHTPRHPLNC